MQLLGFYDLIELISENHIMLYDILEWKKPRLLKDNLLSTHSIATQQGFVFI